LEEGKIYFASDFHLGIPDYESSLKREKLLVKWLDESLDDAREFYLMGDIFDFWFEYKSVIPKGFVRLLGKLAEITDKGIPVHLFTGNHDIWAFSYLSDELGIKIHREPLQTELLGKKFYLAHGDGLGPGDNGYKFLKKVFSNRFNQWMFRWLHPDIGAGMALYFSKKSRISNMIKEGRKENGTNIKDEMLYKYAEGLVQEGKDIDIFIFGHRHLPVNIELSEKSRLVILGDWISNFSYAVFDGEKIDLKYFKK
jgi:UDP-2,3-diacylglucosamine hydrolase